LDTVVLLLVELIGSIVISLSRCCLPNDEGPGPQIFFPRTAPDYSWLIVTSVLFWSRHINTVLYYYYSELRSSVYCFADLLTAVIARQLCTCRTASDAIFVSLLYFSSINYTIIFITLSDTYNIFSTWTPHRKTSQWQIRCLITKIAQLARG